MKREIRIIVTLFFALTFLLACSQQSGTEEQATVQKPQEEQAQSAPEQKDALPVAERLTGDSQSEQAAAANDEIEGTVVRTEEGIVIFSDRGSFVVAGQDLAGLVGKNVRVTGTIEEAEGKSVVTISSVSVIE